MSRLIRHFRSLALTFFAVANFCAGQNAPPLVKQARLGENACGPCAVVNALLHAAGPYRGIMGTIEGESPHAKAEDLIRRFSSTPSEAYDGEMAYAPERGITWVDLAVCLNTLLAGRGIPPLENSFLDRHKDEALDEHVRRIHHLLAESIRKGMPVVTSIRSFAPKQRDDGKHEWAGLHGHYITILSVQERVADGEMGFRFTYSDSFTGKIETGYAFADKARNFTAAKGDGKQWEWVPDRPFLLITAPTLRLGTQKQPWHLRTIITLNHAVYAKE